MSYSIELDREGLNDMLKSFKEGKTSNFGLRFYHIPHLLHVTIEHFSQTFSQLNEVCEMQTSLHEKHYDIDKDNPMSSQLKVVEITLAELFQYELYSILAIQNDLSEIKAVNGIYEEMKKLSDKIHSLTTDN